MVLKLLPIFLIWVLNLKNDMVEISVYLTMADYANKVCKIRERINCSSIDIPITAIYSVFKYLYPQSVIELVIA